MQGLRKPLGLPQKLRRTVPVLALSILASQLVAPVFTGPNAEARFLRPMMACDGYEAWEEQRRETLKTDLLEAIATFKTLEAEGGAVSVDFGVRGGEINGTSKAPRNLASAGAFYAVSDRLGNSADEVLKLAKKLGSLSPTQQPLSNFGTAQGAGCPLHGTWKLLFTTAADATFSRGSKRGDAAVCNVVDAVAGTITNCIDFRREAGEPVPALERLRVKVAATVDSSNRLNLAFRTVQATITKFFGIPLGRSWTLTLPVPFPLLNRVMSFFTGKEPPRPYFELLYLDDSLRIHRTGEGNVFVQARAKPEM